MMAPIGNIRYRVKSEKVEDLSSQGQMLKTLQLSKPCVS
jgi:hypothetical protein